MRSRLPLLLLVSCATVGFVTLGAPSFAAQSTGANDNLGVPSLTNSGAPLLSQGDYAKEDFQNRAPEARKKLAQPEPSECEGIRLGKAEKKKSPVGAAQKTKKAENQPGISSQPSRNAS